MITTGRTETSQGSYGSNDVSRKGVYECINDDIKHGKYESAAKWMMTYNHEEKLENIYGVKTPTIEQYSRSDMIKSFRQLSAVQISNFMRFLLNKEEGAYVNMAADIYAALKINGDEKINTILPNIKPSAGYKKMTEKLYKVTAREEALVTVRKWMDAVNTPENIAKNIISSVPGNKKTIDESSSVIGFQLKILRDMDREKFHGIMAEVEELSPLFHDDLYEKIHAFYRMDLEAEAGEYVKAKKKYAQ